jgi:aspartate kinase
MAIHSPSIPPEQMRKAKEELEECGEVSIINKMAILSLVGAEMKNMVGVAGKMFSTLGENNVNV